MTGFTAQCLYTVSSAVKLEAHRCRVGCAAEIPLVLCLDSGRAFVYLILLASGGFPFLQESQLVEDT